MSAEYGDQLIVHFLEKPKEQYFRSDDGPLRLTILGEFGSPDSRQDELDDELSIMTRRLRPITAIAEEEDLVGRKHNIPVRMIGSEALHSLHYRLANLIEDKYRVGGVVRDEASFRRLYRPYVELGGSIAKGNEIKIRDFSLVKRLGSDLEVVKTYGFEG